MHSQPPLQPIPEPVFYTRQPRRRPDIRRTNVMCNRSLQSQIRLTIPSQNALDATDFTAAQRPVSATMRSRDLNLVDRVIGVEAVGRCVFALLEVVEKASTGWVARVVDYDGTKAPSLACEDVTRSPGRIGDRHW